VKKMLAVLLTATLLLGLTFQTLPYLVRDQLVLWFYGQGVEDARLRTLSLNWFTGELNIRGLSLQREGYTPLRLDHLQLDLSLKALLDKQIRIEQFRVLGLHGGIAQRDDQLWLGPVPLPSAEAGEENTGSADTGGSNWQFGLDQVALNDIRWLSDWQGQRYPLQIDSAELLRLYQWAPLEQTDIALKGRLNGAPLTLSSAGTPLQASPQFSAAINLEAVPLDNLMALAQQPLRATLSSNLQLTLQLNPLQVKAEGSLALAKLDWSAEQQAAVRNLSWKGTAQWQGETSAADFDGALALKGIALTLPEQLELKAGAARWNGKGELALEKGLKASLKGKLGLAKLAAALPADQRAALAELNWQGDVVLRQPTDQALQLTTNNRVELQQLSLQQKQLVARLSQLVLNNSVELKGEQWALQQPEMNATSLSVSDGDYPLVSLGAVALNEVSASATQAKLAALELTGLQLARVNDEENPRPLSQWQQLRVEQLSWQPERLSINEVQINGGDTLLRRDEQGALVDIELLKQRLAALQPASSEEPGWEKPATESTPMVIQLTGLSVRQPHQLRFQDRSVKPAFNFNGELSQLAVGPWDSEGKRPTDLNLLAKLNGDGDLKLHGVLDTATMQSGGWTLDVSGVEMPYLSPYAMEYTGYYVQSGQLALNSKGTLKSGQLEGKNHLQLNNFDVEPREQDKVSKVSQQLSMPLETAVMVLEDDDQNIDLDLDISGSLDDPNFGYQSVINSLAGKGLKTAAMSYLTKSLQPYATLLSLAKTAVEAGEKGTFISLQPVSFAPGSASLNGDMKGYIGKLTEILTERPAMRLKLCGNAVAADRKLVQAELDKANSKRKKPLSDEALANRLQVQLQTLAQQRSEKVKEALARTVDKKRLFVCYPQVAMDSDAAPAVSVGI